MKYPIGMQTFSELIDGNYVYVDKTSLIHDLVSQGKWYFFSRPRRFGKSLLVSTLQAVFEGKKELFKGLDIEAERYAFKPHSVIKLEFTKAEITKAEDFRRFIGEQVNRVAREYQILLVAETFESRFDELISSIHKKWV